MVQASLFAWGEPEPEPTPRVVAPSLWPHQRKQKAAVEGDLAKPDVRSVIVVSATGSGKTTTISAIAKDWPGRVLVIGHRDEIITQLQDRLHLVTGEPVDREQAEFRAGGARLCVASIQTISRESRLKRFAPDYFSLVVPDECHHAVSPTYRAVLNYFSGAKIAGFTATPDRGDRLALGEVFDAVAGGFVFDVTDAIKADVLVPFHRRRVVLDVDLSKIGSSRYEHGKDLNAQQLDAAMGDSHALEGVAKPTFELAGDRKTVLFTTSVMNAQKLAEILNGLRSGCARAVYADMGIDNRRAAMDGYANGEFQFLCNVGIATEGWDDPPTSCVAIGRPTQSRALLEQMVGRGLRKHPGKRDCLILEFTDKTERHDIASVMDVLGGKFSDEEIKLAKERDGSKPGQRLDLLLEAARTEIQERLRRKVKYSVREVDPFSVFHVEHDALDWQFGRKDPTENQLNGLRKWGIPFPKDISRRDASKLLGTAGKRSDLGLASYKQLQELQRFGITDINLKHATAKKLIMAIDAKGGRSLTPAEYMAALERTVGEDG